MEFKEWWQKEREKYFMEPTLPELQLSKAAWQASRAAALDEAIEVINSHPAITDIEGYPIFPELADKLKELKQ